MPSIYLHPTYFPIHPTIFFVHLYIIALYLSIFALLPAIFAHHICPHPTMSAPFPTIFSPYPYILPSASPYLPPPIIFANHICPLPLYICPQPYLPSTSPYLPSTLPYNPPPTMCDLVMSPHTVAPCSVNVPCFPMRLRDLCHCLYQVVSLRFADGAISLLGSTLFLRHFIPAVGNYTNTSLFITHAKLWLTQYLPLYVTVETLF